jgi:hypothetical protein
MPARRSEADVNASTNAMTAAGSTPDIVLIGAGLTTAVLIAALSVSSGTIPPADVLPYVTGREDIAWGGQIGRAQIRR